MVQKKNYWREGKIHYHTIKNDTKEIFRQKGKSTLHHESDTEEDLGGRANPLPHQWKRKQKKKNEPIYGGGAAKGDGIK